MKYIAVILAGGSGTRMGLSRPKQFLELAGRTVLEHSVDAFVSHADISEVIIVSNPDFTTEAEAIVASRRETGEWSKVKAVICGGRERSDSSVNALRHVMAQLDAEAAATGMASAERAEDVALLFHDAVRPLVDARIIGEVCKALSRYAAVNVAVPVVDTLMRCAPDAQNTPCCTTVVDRANLQRVQTPQGFRLTTIAEAYRCAMADPDFVATDDCGVVMRYLPEVPVAIVRGSERNLKLTYPADIPLFEFLIRG